MMAIPLRALAIYVYQFSFNHFFPGGIHLFKTSVETSKLWVKPV